MVVNQKALQDALVTVFDNLQNHDCYYDDEEFALAAALDHSAVIDVCSYDDDSIITGDNGVVITLEDDTQIYLTIQVDAKRGN